MVRGHLLGLVPSAADTLLTQSQSVTQNGSTPLDPIHRKPCVYEGHIKKISFLLASIKRTFQAEVKDA